RPVGVESRHLDVGAADVPPENRLTHRGRSTKARTRCAGTRQSFDSAETVHADKGSVAIRHAGFVRVRAACALVAGAVTQIRPDAEKLTWRTARGAGGRSPRQAASTSAATFSSSAARTPRYAVVTRRFT